MVQSWTLSLRDLGNKQYKYQVSVSEIDWMWSAFDKDSSMAEDGKLKIFSLKILFKYVYYYKFCHIVCVPLKAASSARHRWSSWPVWETTWLGRMLVADSWSCSRTTPNVCVSESSTTTARTAWGLGMSQRNSCGLAAVKRTAMEGDHTRRRGQPRKASVRVCTTPAMAGKNHL